MAAQMSPQPAGGRRSRIGRWIAPAALVVIYTACYWLKLPDPATFLWQPDWGYQLAGATAILHGRWPFADFHAVYGPLVFLCSAIGQWLTGGRLIGEIALSYAGFLVSYLLLYRLTGRISGSRAIAFGVVLFALLVFPRPYKYYIVLTPLWVMWECWRYLEKPSVGRLFLLALAVTVTGLFRPDTGVYAVIAGIVCVALAYRGEPGKGGRQLGLYAALLVICISPWLIFLIVRHGLFAYFYQSIVDGIGLGKGLSLPWPRINFRHDTFSQETFVAIFYNFFFTLVPFCAIAAYADRRGMPWQEKKRLIVTMVLAQGCLMEATHRPDYQHLNQALVPSLVLAGWGLARIPEWIASRAGWWRVAGVLSVAALAFLLIAAVVVEKRIGYGEVKSGSASTMFRVYAGTVPDVLAYVLREQPGNPYAATAEFLRNGTSSGDRVFIMPYYDTLYYFSGRSFGRYMEILPGLSSSARDQEDLVADLAKENVRLVVVDPNFELDDRPERRVDRFCPIVLNYVMSRYRPAAQFGPFSVRERAAVSVTR